MKVLEKYDHLFPVFILLLGLLFFWQKGTFDFIFTENFAGVDLVGNYAFSWMMKNLVISGKISGWSNLWFAGFPAFEFYPPLFFFATSMVNIFSFGLVSTEMSFKLVVFFSLFFFPLIAYYSFKKMGFKSLESLLVSFFSFGFLFSVAGFSAVHHTLNYGFVTQMFAINLLLIFLGFLVSIKTWKGVLVSGIFLGFLLLSHPFIAILAFLGLFLRLATKVKDWKEIVTVGLLGLFLSLGWWLNAFLHVGFMSNYTLQTWAITDFPLILIPLILASLKNYKKYFIFLALMTLSVLLGTLGPSVMQPLRFFQYSILFAFLLSGLGTYEIYKLFEKKKARTWIKNSFVLIVFVLLAASILLSPIENNWESESDDKNLMNYLKNLDEGRILAESKPYPIWERYILEEKIPIETGKPVLNELHVDSSLSGPYTTLLKSLVFTGKEHSHVCELCENVSSKEIAENLLNRYGVKYLITEKFGLKHSESFEKLKEIGNFTVYEFNQTDDKYYEILEYKPILIKSSLNKWKWLNEKLYQEEKLWEVNVVWSQKDVKNESMFSSVIEIEDESEWNEIREKIKDYGYQKLDAKAEIKDFLFSDEKISMYIDSEEPVPVLLKFSYYPKWKIRGGDLYLINPSLMMVYGKGQVELEYETSNIQFPFFSNFSS